MLTVQQQQAAILRNEARIADLLKWTTSEYATFLWNCGLQYLSAFIGFDENGMNYLNQRAEFWNWWKNQWNMRNEIFINDCDGLEDTLTTNSLLKIYRDLHNPEVLACEIHPPRTAIGPDFVTHQLVAI